MTPTIAEVLDQAADLIQFTGWNQGDYWLINENEEIIGFCALGALGGIHEDRKELDNWLIRQDAKEALVRYLGLIERGDIGHWNDAEDRTAQDVIDALRGCAKVQREIEQAAR